MGRSSALVLLATAASAQGGDPSTSWLSYVEYRGSGTITQMNATVVVPENPEKIGADPSFW